VETLEKAEAGEGERKQRTAREEAEHTEDISHRESQRDYERVERLSS
jgi:hypothetical protein